MGRKKRLKIEKQQRHKRQKRRAKLEEQNLTPDNYFYSGYYLK